MDSDDHNLTLPNPVKESNEELHNVIPGMNTANSVKEEKPQTAPKNIDSDKSINKVLESDLMANDDDLIEKEWVIKAERLAKDYRNDPYNQAKQLNSLKAEYVKKRYNKIVATDD